MPPKENSEVEDTLDFAALKSAELNPYLKYLYGNRFAEVVVIKGEPGAVELAGGQPFFGEDAQALESALNTLGWGSNNWCGVITELPGEAGLSAGDVRLLIEIIDPRAVVALDSHALEILWEGLASGERCAEGKVAVPQKPRPGQNTLFLGRMFVAVNGFETALASKDEKAKRRVWRELKALKN